MKNLILSVAIGVMALLWANPVFAADGDRCFGGTPPAAIVVSFTKPPVDGDWRVVCNIMCEDYDAGQTCDQWDFQKTGETGIPSKVFVEVYQNTSCADGWSVDIKQTGVTGPPAGTNEHDVVTLNASTTSAMIGVDLPIMRFWNVVVSPDTSCDSLDILIHKYYKKTKQ